jgi:hypothetical protein
MARKSGILTAEDLGLLGQSIGSAMAAYQSRERMGARPYAFKETSLTPTTVSIYGRNSIFDPCAPGDIFGLQVQTTGFINWIGWRPNRFYRRRVTFIPWVGPAGLAGSGSITKANGAPCSDPNSWEYGVCGYDLTHTSWYHRSGEALDPHTIVQDRCETSPRYRLNGVAITDDVEWQMNGIMNVLQQDIKHDLIYGSHSNSYQMDGLESLIKTSWLNDDGTTCDEVGSILVDWNADDLNGTNNNFGNFFDYLDEVVTEIEYRGSALGTIAETDMILLTSRFMATALLDAYACYTTCGVTDTNDTTDQALRAQQRAARMALNGGPLYDGASAVGFLNLKSGRRLPIIVDDTMPISKPNANYVTDIYLLTRRVGSIDVLYGEYLDMRVYENRVRAQMPSFTARSDAAGRFVTKGKEDNWCIQFQMGTSPEIYLAAPYLQARFQDVGTPRKRTPVSGDPHNPEYLPGGRPLYKASTDV